MQATGWEGGVQVAAANGIVGMGVSGGGVPSRTTPTGSGAVTANPEPTKPLTDDAGGELTAKHYRVPVVSETKSQHTTCVVETNSRHTIMDCRGPHV
jgi:hypothetical protein